MDEWTPIPIVEKCGRMGRMRRKGDPVTDFQTRTDVGRRLVRPRDNRWIAGVCSGLARRFGLRPNLVRLLFVLSCLLPGPQFLIYIMAWVIIPSE
jgi:phage shock protein PspC (stress-responsive transcriptional regulator)